MSPTRAATPKLWLQNCGYFKLPRINLMRLESNKVNRFSMFQGNCLNSELFTEKIW